MNVRVNKYVPQMRFICIDEKLGISGPCISEMPKVPSVIPCKTISDKTLEHYD
jgi:hypothetical protein